MQRSLNLYNPSPFLSYSSSKYMTVNHIFISPYEDKPITFCPRLSLISSVFFSSVLSPHPPRLCCMADALCKLPDVQGSLCWTAGHYYEGQTHAHTSKPVLTHTDVTLCPSESQLQMSWPTSWPYVLTCLLHGEEAQIRADYLSSSLPCCTKPLHGSLQKIIRLFNWHLPC